MTTIRADAHRPEFHRAAPPQLPVRVASTANVTIATGLNAGDTIDGVTLAAGDRVLLKNQSTGAENGIYIAGATPERAFDMLEGVAAYGAVIYVVAGTAGGGKTFVCTNTTVPTIDTTALTFADYTPGGSSAPTTADYLVGTSQAGLSAEIVVGTTPGGELGNTWASPTVDSTHSGSAHTDFIAKSVLTTQDDIIVRDASAPARLAKGSDGQVLTVDPTTHHLVWATPASAPSFATPAIALSTAAAAGAAATVIRSDSTIVAFDVTAPVTQGFSDVAAVGSAAVAARRDHKHGMPADPGGSGGTVAVESIYGNGADGDVVISVDTNVDQDAFYHDLTVNTGINLVCRAVKIHVSGTLTLNGTIHNNCLTAGGNGGNGTNLAGGAAGGAGAGAVTSSTNTLPATNAGLVGKIGGFNANGVAGTNSTVSRMNISHATSAAGGDSGTGRTGGAGIAAAAGTNVDDRPYAYPHVYDLNNRTGAVFASNLYGGLTPSAGSGAGSASSGGGGSGGSGGEGGRVVVCARTITGPGNIEAKGGNGGNGGNGGGTNAGGGAGGSGGVGGWITLLYKDKTGWSGSLNVSGGSGGSFGTGVGSGSSGNTGTGGATGHAYQFKMG